jgi:uncharacterized lipoprotein YmbA
MTMPAKAYVCSGLCALNLAACALTSRSEPLSVRYYTLEDGSPEPAPKQAQGIELRMGRVEASKYLGEEIAFRDTQHELQFSDSLRWTEKPEEYLRRALTRMLYQERGLTRAFSGGAPTLDVELVEFDVLRGAQPKVRLQAIAILHDDRRSQLEETITVERPVDGPVDDRSEAAAAAFSAALRAAVSSVADRVIAALASGPAVATAGPKQPCE